MNTQTEEIFNQFLIHRSEQRERDKVSGLIVISLENDKTSTDFLPGTHVYCNGMSSTLVMREEESSF